LKFNLKTCLFIKNIDESIVETKHMNEKRHAYEEARRQYETTYKEWEDNGKQGDEPEEPHAEKLDKVTYNLTNVQYAIVVDTLGQDRTLTFNQRKYIFKIVKHMKNVHEFQENDGMANIVNLVLEQDPQLLKDFESDYKNNKDRVLDKYD